jgi:hypothetical protein
MKLGSYRVAASLSLFVGLAMPLQSCFIWKTNIDWSSLDSRATLAQPQPKLDIYKRPGFFLLPFVVVAYSTGKYRLDFMLRDRRAFEGVDSVRYKIFIDNREEYTGSLIPKVHYYNTNGWIKELSKIKASADTVRQITFTARLRDFAIDKNVDSIKLDFDVFAKNDLGKTQIIRYTNCKLKKDGKKFGSFL